MENAEMKNARIGQSRSERDSNSSAPAGEPKEGVVAADGTIKLCEAVNLEDTAYRFSTWRKWQILTVVALCQTSMSELSPASFRLHMFISLDVHY